MGRVVSDNLKEKYFLIVRIIIMLLFSGYGVMINEEKTGVSAEILLLISLYISMVCLKEFVDGRKKAVFLVVAAIDIISVLYMGGAGYIFLGAFLFYEILLCIRARRIWYYLIYMTIFIEKYILVSIIEEMPLDVITQIIILTFMLVFYMQHEFVVTDYEKQMMQDTITQQSLKRDMRIQETTAREQMKKNILMSENKVLEERAALSQTLHDKLGHNMTRVAAKAPTCGVAGNPEYYVCSRCADVYYADAAGAEKYTADEIVLPALSHNWGVTSVTDPTCTEAGFTTVTCANCGETKKTDERPANGHQGGVATCLEKAVCEVCGEAYGGLADHQYVTVTDEGDCQHNGVSVKTCSVCGDEVTTELPLGPHQPEYVVLSAPTCTENGASQWVCTVCGEVIEEGTLEAMGHHDDNGDGKCDKCGQSMNGSTDGSGNGTTTGVCDKCGRNHVGKTGGFWGYDGFVCKLISFFRSIVRLFSK